MNKYSETNSGSETINIGKKNILLSEEPLTLLMKK
ncbi:uncharacterized protein METZ01_LOCUS98181, partial [marine metagenome]